MMLTPNRVPDTSLTVRLTPSSATEPLGAINGISASGASNTKRTDSASGRRSTIRASPSTWPETRCPPNSSPSRKDCSRLTGVPSGQPPIVVRARVSAEACTVKAPSSTAITVRHGPEHAIEAPIAIAAVSNAVAMVSSASAPRRTRRTRPRSVTMPVNMPTGYGPRRQIYQPPLTLAAVPVDSREPGK